MSRLRFYASALAFVAPTLLWESRALAADLILDGNMAGPAVCPDGGTAVDRACQVNATPALNTGCRYGGEKTFGTVSLTNNARVCVTPFDGTDRVNTGNLVLKADVITIDASSMILAKGSGYQAGQCLNGRGPAAFPLSGGRGGCGVRDSGGGGAHFGIGGRGTKDAPTSFPAGFEEDCLGTVTGNTCASFTDCRNNDGLPTVAGLRFTHSIYAIEFGAAGGDKGCRDGDGFSTGSLGGHGGGRVVLFAANAGQTGSVTINGLINANGRRGCAGGNDSAGGGAGGSVLIIGDTVSIGPTAQVLASGGRGGDSQPKCLPCTTSAECATGQTCTAGRCGPCNCTPCTNNAQCNTLLGQTCKNLGGSLGNVCADAANQCTPFDPADNEVECRGAQNSGLCDDCAGGGGGGIINVQSRQATIHPHAVFNVRGANGGICPICTGEAGGGAGELQIDSAYVGEICDGWDNDFDGQTDEGLGMITCPDMTMIPACVNGIPQICDYDPAKCKVPASDARPRFALVLDTSGSMLNDLSGNPTFGDGSVKYPGVDTSSDPDMVGGNNSRLFIAKEALTQVLSAFPESDYSLGRYYQDVGVNRSCQSAANFECAQSCCSYDDPTNNLPPPYPALYPDNQCILSQLYPTAGYPMNAAFTGNMPIGWPMEAMEMTPTSDCINYAGSCGPPRRGAQFVVGFNQPISKYLKWLDGVEDPDAMFDASIMEGNHCAAGNCELRGSGPTPLAGSLQATYDYLKPIVTCDGAAACRSYATILLTDGAESCQGNPAGEAATLFAGINGKSIKTYVIGFSVLPTEQAQLNQIAASGGTNQAFFVSSKSELANALAQIIGQNQKFEVCNNLDDDCDVMVDEDFPEKGQPCTDGELGACLGTGTYVCKADGSGTECGITDPGAMPSTEVCNNMDDDCDGLVDEDPTGLPLDCPNCTPSPEICDGIDNDCDFQIDEEPDVSTNQPQVYGVPCGMLMPPNDQAPCQLGKVLCINSKPVCVGFIGPQQEICNGLDEDCDGIGDNMAVCPGVSKCVEAQCAIPCESGEFPCPPGTYCSPDNYCLKATCDNVTCNPGQVCVDGICIKDPMTGSSSSSGNGGAGGGTAGAGGMASTSSGMGGVAGNGGSAGEGGSPDDGVYGLPTGAGGCHCNIAGDERRDGQFLAAIIALACLSRARRGVRGRKEAS